MAWFQVPPPQKCVFSKPEEWSKWSKIFERFRVATRLELQPKENQVNTLRHRTSSHHFRSIIEYNTVTERLNEHIVVQRNVIFEHAKFNMRQQEAG